MPSGVTGPSPEGTADSSPARSAGLAQATWSSPEGTAENSQDAILGALHLHSNALARETNLISLHQFSLVLVQ